MTAGKAGRQGFGRAVAAYALADVRCVWALGEPVRAVRCMRNGKKGGNRGWTHRWPFLKVTAGRSI